MPDLVSDRAFQALTQNGDNLRRSFEMASRIVVAEYIREVLSPGLTAWQGYSLADMWLEHRAADLDAQNRIMGSDHA